MYIIIEEHLPKSGYIEMRCLIGLASLVLIFLFKFLFISYGLTCIILSSVYIITYVQAIMNGVAVTNWTFRTFMLFVSFELIALGVVLLLGQ